MRRRHSVTFNTTTVNAPVIAVSTTGQDTPGLRQGALGNPNLKPELSAETEVGFEARALRNRVNLDVTYYNKQTRDALISQNIAPSAGPATTSVLRNLGSVKNTGIEASIQAQLVDRRAFGWDVTLSGTHESNKLVSLGVDANGIPNKTIGTGSLRRFGGVAGECVHLPPLPLHRREPRRSDHGQRSHGRSQLPHTSATRCRATSRRWRAGST